MKNVIKLNHYFCPSELEKAIDEWVKYYNERRFHESLDNLTPRDVYLGQGEKIKKIREIIKQNSINKRIFHFKMDDRLLVIFYALGNILFAAFFDVGSLRLQQDGDLRKTLLELLHFYLSIH